MNTGGMQCWKTKFINKHYGDHLVVHMLEAIRKYCLNTKLVLCLDCRERQALLTRESLLNENFPAVTTVSWNNEGCRAWFEE